MTMIRVLKPFRFTFPVQREDRTPTEQAFAPHADGKPKDVELPDDHPLLSHPWFLQDHCDGRVESPAQAKARLEAEAQRLKQQEAENAISRAAAESSLARMSRKSEDVVVDNDAYQRELNTPIPQLREQQAKKRAPGIDTPISKLS